MRFSGEEQQEEQGEREREDEGRVGRAGVRVRGLALRRGLRLLVVGLRVLHQHRLEGGAVAHSRGAQQRGGRPRELAGAGARAAPVVAVHCSPPPLPAAVALLNF